MSSLHTINHGKHAPEVVTAIIEIPRGSRAKYEIDKDSGMLKLDRVLFSSMYYPTNYGFIPQTHCQDGDPLDILVISAVDIQPLCLVEARVVGVLRMVDGGEADDKIIAVAAHDVTVQHIKELADLPAHFVEEVKNFFQDYKKLEHKKVEITGVNPRSVALTVVNQSIADYKKLKKS